MSVGAGASWRNHVSLQGNNSQLVKASQGALGSAWIENRGASNQWLHLFDKITTGTVGEAPLLSFLLLPGGVTVLDHHMWGEEGQAFQRGIAYGISSTVATFTPGTTDTTVQLWYF
jgi:hypothetical protein